MTNGSQSVAMANVEMSSDATGDGQINAVASATRTLENEAAALSLLRSEFDGPLGARFADAIRLILACRGRVIVAGIGKSGHIGQKIAATFASTGTPAFFVHPSEASHGDLGMITEHDVLVVLSWSGETVELFNILAYARQNANPVISITSSETSSLGRSSDIVLKLPRAAEACPHGLAPTTTTTMQLALGDALAIAVLEAKGFTAHDFKVFHPGGSLGAQLRRVREVMHKRDELPLVAGDTVMSEALVTMTQRSFGCLGVIDAGGHLIGVITDGDLRRHMGRDLVDTPVAAVMTRGPMASTRAFASTLNTLSGRPAAAQTRANSRSVSSM